jgi:hypothetical protein
LLVFLGSISFVWVKYLAILNSSFWFSFDESIFSSSSITLVNFALLVDELGFKTTASRYYSHAEGAFSNATEFYSHAEGYITTASDEAAHAEGENTLASGICAHAEGFNTTASANISHAEGGETLTSAICAHAEGNGSTASGYAAHAEGYYTEAASSYQHVFGKYNTVDSNDTYVEIVGKGTSSSAKSNARTLDWSGNETLAGKLTVGTQPTANMDVATKKYVDDAVTNAIAQVLANSY